jgi:hypothetical protein
MTLALYLTGNLEVISSPVELVPTNASALMMQDAHERRFDAVLVWRFDRFARSVSHLLRALETLGFSGR